MPCYQVNTVSLKFKAKNIDLIIDVLKLMNLNPLHRNDKISTNIGTFDLKTGNVTVRQNNIEEVNKFRINYSEAILQKAAKKNKWILKKRSQQEYVAKKW